MGFIAACFLLAIAPCVGVSAAAPSDSLWLKAVGIYERNALWIPGLTVMSFELLDDKGERKESQETWYRLAQDPQGYTLLEVEKSVKNGNDVTQADRDAQRKRNEKAKKEGAPAQFPMSMADSPFDPLVQESLTISRKSEERVMDGVRCAAYDFTLKKKDGASVRGTAWIEGASGTPVEAGYTFAPLPTGVTRMNITLRYANGPQGPGFLKEVRIEGSGGFLFIRRNFRFSLVLSEYRLRPVTSRPGKE